MVNISPVRDGSSLTVGEATAIKIKANAVVRVPLLEVRGVMEGLEDIPLPLLSQLEGVINAQLRGNGAGQTLELELTGLPEGSMLVESDKGGDGKSAQSFSPALNRDELGQLNTKLRLPYSQRSNVFWQGPAHHPRPRRQSRLARHAQHRRPSASTPPARPTLSSERARSQVKGSYVAQYEHTILLRPTCKEVLSRGDDF